MKRLGFSKVRSILFHSLFFFFISMIANSCDYEKVVVVSPLVVENLIEKHCPIHFNVSIAHIQLDNPKIRFKDNEINLNFRFDVSWLDQSFNGLLKIVGTLIYVPASRGFYFHHFKVKDIDFDRVPKELEEDIYGKESNKDKAHVTEFEQALIEATTSEFDQYFNDKTVFSLSSHPQLDNRVGEALERIEIRKNRLKLYLKKPL